MSRSPWRVLHSRVQQLTASCLAETLEKEETEYKIQLKIDFFVFGR